MKSLILLAVQGAGKGTVAKALEEKYNYAHISTGDILRERTLVKDELGSKIKELIDNGELVSDDIIFEAVEYRITQPDCENGYILDGIPRTLLQAEKYDELLRKLNKDAGLVINMTVPDEVLIERITSRRICKECGKIYNINFAEMKPKIDGKCDDCDSELIFRDDDSNEEAISRRISTYHKNAEAIINFYKEKGILYNVDSTETKYAIQEVEKIIGG
jgi:adenylate kinases